MRFDMPRGEYTHEGDRCTFEVLCTRFGLARRRARGDRGNRPRHRSQGRQVRPTGGRRHRRGAARNPRVDSGRRCPRAARRARSSTACMRSFARGADAMTVGARPTRLLSQRDVARLLDIESCIDAVEDAFRLHGGGRTLTPGVLGTHADRRRIPRQDRGARRRARVLRRQGQRELSGESESPRTADDSGRRAC